MRAGALGDFILSLPLLRERCRAGGPVCLITRSSYRDLLPPGCVPAAFLPADSPAVSALFAPGGGAESPAFAGATVMMGGGAVPLSALFADATVCLFMRADPILSQSLKSCGVRHITWLEPRPVNPPHVALRFLRDAGFAAGESLLDEPLWRPDAARPGHCLWVHPGSGSPRKNWAPDNFARYAAAWQQRHGELVVVSFGEADTSLRDAALEALVHHGVRHEVVEGVSPAALRGQLVRRAAAFIGNDSGVTHLAAASGIPTVALFLATDPAIWRPLGQVTIVGPQAAATLWGTVG